MAITYWNIEQNVTVSDDSELLCARVEVEPIELTDQLLLMGWLTFGDIDPDATNATMRYRLDDTGGQQIGPSFTLTVDAIAAAGGLATPPPVQLPAGYGQRTPVALTVQFVGASGGSEVPYAALVVAYGDMPIPSA